MPQLIPPVSSHRAGRLPDFLVIGTAKGGTSALDSYLRRHPQVAMPREKELNFFLDAGVLPDDPRGFDRGAWQMGTDWYRRWFQTDRPICGEVSPNYALGSHAEQVAERIAAVVPRARLVYILRNPLERARSNFLMLQKRPGAAAVSFADYLASSDAVSTSCYGAIYEAYLRHVPREQILVLESAALDGRRRESLATVFRFLGVDDRFWCRGYERRVYVGSRRPFVSPLGARVRDSGPLRFLRRRMPPSIFYHVENLALGPFGVPPPSLALPPGQAAEVVARWRSDLDLLRRLTGLDLPSLDVCLEQAVHSRAVEAAAAGSSR